MLSIAGSPDPEVLAKLTAGVWLSDGKVRAKRARLVGRQGQANVLELVLAEGKNREIRRMLAKLGHKVMSLNRVAVGPISVKGLSSGECRSLSRHEVDLLWKVANGAAVSLPRFLDGDSSSRPPRDSSRHREAGHGPYRAGSGRPTANAPRRFSAASSAPARSPKQSRPRCRRASINHQPPESPPTDVAPRRRSPASGTTNPEATGSPPA